LRQFGVRKEDLVKIDYRGMGWPGYMRLQLRSGKELVVKYNRGWNAYWNVFSPHFFTPLACLVCSDQSNELADVSIGDAWFQELVNRGMGESIIISRTTFAEELLANAENKGNLFLQNVSADKVKASQRFGLIFKKRDLPHRFSFFRVLGEIRLASILTKRSFSYMSLIAGFFPYLSYRLSSNSCSRHLLCYVPLSLFRLYFGFFRVVIYLTLRE